MPSCPAHRLAPARRAARTGAVVVAAALALAACSADVAPAPDAATPAATPAETSPAPSSTPTEPSADPSPSPSDTPSPQAEEPAPADTPTYPSFDPHTDRALQTIAAMEATFGAGAFKVEGDDDGTRWKLELTQGGDRLKVKAEANDTGIATTDTKRDDLGDDDREALGRAQVSLSEAIVRVVESSGGVLDKAELEEDDGIAYWEVEVDLGDDDEHYRVDVATGTLSRES
ncbi:PepSY domain-containing protein [Isoptericola sp. AK164]|uniref:PepSY domain-containing protein n=1 Tax=Isoptericola sp. AK164 TaxID=3024246 RepID=UPI0024186461|nr:PepSY domain-containing protein [Isoptericola sp. AK164]